MSASERITSVVGVMTASHDPPLIFIFSCVSSVSLISVWEAFNVFFCLRAEDKIKKREYKDHRNI